MKQQMRTPKERHQPEVPPTTDRLRKDIDRGRTRDKVAFPDPAAAPLGTDDEAAGTPAGGSELLSESRALTPTAPPPRPHRRMTVVAAGLALLVILAILIGAALT